MRIITLIKNNFSYCLLLAAFLGSGFIGYSQCPTVTIAAQSFCDIQAPTIVNLQATDNGGGIKWYDTDTSTTSLPGDVVLVNGEDYFADDNTGSCGARQKVVVTIYKAPTGQSFQGVCVENASEATISDLVAVGNNVQWYTTPSGGVALLPTTQLTDNTLYYAGQTNPDTGCITSRLAVLVNVGIVPVATGNAVQEFCNDPGNFPTVGDLVASENNNWYFTSSSAVPLDLSMPLINGHKYYATTLDPPCESTTRFEVLVIINELNDAGSDGVEGICEDQVASTPPFDLYDLLGGTPDNVGVWSGPLSTANGYKGTVDVSTMTSTGSPYVFTYTVSSATCPTDTSTVTINIIALPNASLTVDNSILCSGSASTLTFTGTPNATVVYTVNAGANQNITLDGSGTATLNGTYSVNTAVKLVSVTAAGSPGCTKALTQEVTITVIDPTASVSANPATVCSGDATVLTFAGTPNATVVYTENGGASQNITLGASGSATLNGTYSVNTTIKLVSVTTAGEPSCAKALTQEVTITVIAPTASVSASPTTVCSGDATVLTFTGTPNATVVYTVNAGADQNITLDASGAATLNGTYSVNTTIKLVSVTTVGSPSCTKALNQEITIAVLDPTASVAANPTVICSGGTSVLTFTGTPNASVVYTLNGGANQTITLDGSGSAALNGTYLITTTIKLVSVTTAGLPSCTKALTQEVMITVTDPTASVSASPVTVCSGNPTTLTFTGTPNATVVYTENGGANQNIALDASGTAILNKTYLVDSTIALVSVTIAGTPSCTKALNQQLIIMVIDPVASVSATPTAVCSGDATTLTFTGTPNATVVYTVITGINQNITLDASGIATLSGTYSANTTVKLVSVTTAGSPSCTKALTQELTITVLDPTASISASPTTVCSGSASILTFTGTPNATVVYTVDAGANQNIILDGSGTATLNGLYSADTIIKLVSVTTAGMPSCTKALTQEVAITVTDPTASVSVNPMTVCFGDAMTLTFTGTPNATVVYSENGGANQNITLDASGNAALSGVYLVTTTIKLVSVTTSGSPSCTKALTQEVTITIIDPVAGVAASPTLVCSGDATTLTFTGTPNATVVYTVNAGTNQNITLDGSGVATLNGTYSVNTAIKLVSVTTAGSPGCTKALNQELIITVLDPTASVSANPMTICAGNASTLTFTGTPNATVVYTLNGGVNQSVVLDGLGTGAISSTYLANTTITLVSVTTSGSPVCTKALTQQLTVTVIDPTASVTASPMTVCSGNPTVLTFTGTPNSAVAYTENGGSVKIAVLDATGTKVLNNVYLADTTIKLISITTSGGSPSCTKSLNQQLVITVITPTASVSANPSTICSGGNSVMTFTGTPNATVTYTVNGGANQTIVLDGSGSATSNNTYLNDTTVTLISVTTSDSPSCTKVLTQSVILTVVPPAEAGVSPSPVELCINSNPIDLFSLLGNTAQTNGTWSPPLASGTGVFNPAIDVSGNYTYTVKGTSPCLDDTATVQVTVKPVPDAGIDGTLNICSNQNPVDLFNSLTGTPQSGGEWLPALASGTGVFDPAVDAAGVYTYTVKGIAPCADDSATVDVTVPVGPEAGGDNSLTLCSNSAPQDLFALLGPNAQSGGVWSPAMASGTSVFNPAIDSQGDYTYTLTGPQPCDNDAAVISVTVNPIPDAGMDGTKVFCSNGTPEDLFSSLGGNPQPGGTWSPSLASGSGIFDPAVDTAQVYTYTVGGNLCTTSIANVTVSILPAPNSGGAGQTLETCKNVVSLDLNTGLDGTQGAGTWSDDDATGALVNNIFNPSLVNAGTYHFTYTVLGTLPCANSSSIVTVVVNPLPNAGTYTGANPSICTSLGVFDLSTLLTGQDSGGIWTDSLGTVVGSPINVLFATQGTYSYTYTVSSLCGSDPETVQFTVLPTPQLANLNISTSPICAGTDAIVNLNGMIDGTYTIDFDLSGSNILPAQQVLVTISSGIGNFTIPSASLSNSGLTTITFTKITENTTFCSRALLGVEAVLDIKPLADIDSTNLTVSNVCFGNNITVDITGATNLPDGVYQFNYAIPGGNPVSGNSGDVTITGGVGQFTILSTVFTTAGNYDLTIFGIIAATGCTNPSENATVNFTVNPLPDVTGATVSTQATCSNYANLVTISGAVGLPDGDYTIDYQLSGANISSSTTVVSFVSGTATFEVSPTELVNAGDTTIDITQIDSVTTSCGISGTVFPSATFSVVVLGTPELVSEGHLFCVNDKPTIAELSANIISAAPVLWYNSQTGGTVYAETDLLENDTTYYGTYFTANGCESAVRLEVTVDLTGCSNIVIPDGFSPNGDGINDEFEIAGIEVLYPNFKLEIFNRYGNLVYEGNKSTQRWNGTSMVNSLSLGNNVLPNGVYFYILNFNDGTKKPVQGRVYLNR